MHKFRTPGVVRILEGRVLKPIGTFSRRHNMHYEEGETFRLMPGDIVTGMIVHDHAGKLINFEIPHPFLKAEPGKWRGWSLGYGYPGAIKWEFVTPLEQLALAAE